MDYTIEDYKDLKRRFDELDSISDEQRERLGLNSDEKGSHYISLGAPDSCEESNGSPEESRMEP